MRTIIVAMLMAISASCLGENYGAEPTLVKPISVEAAITALKQASSQSQEPILIEGTIGSVCQAKGCWMGFTSELGDVRVRFKDYGFFVPFSIVGKTVQAQGVLEQVTLSLKDSKHFVEDAGGDPDTVTEPLVEYQMLASGVRVH